MLNPCMQKHPNQTTHNCCHVNSLERTSWRHFAVLDRAALIGICGLNVLDLKIFQLAGAEEIGGANEKRWEPSSPNSLFLPVYSALEQQSKIFEPKLVLATNVAETSITIENL
ncbi:hypothetical protein BJ741DRAFT_611768 [Chytriomyces cf. hyalinus JEL632]|nr:hypothetical protein BJ741DRAFT_611768 [Chytriomyces cf. hyalinus JEL632]